MRSLLFTIFLAIAVSVSFLATSNAMAKRGFTEIHLEDLKHPYLFFTEKEIEKIRELITVEGTYQHKRFKEFKQNADNWFEKPIAIPTRGGEGMLGYHCADDGTELTYNSDKPDDHECSKCGKVFHGEKYGGWWRCVSHSLIATAVNDMAFVYAITGDEKYAKEAGRILLKYADMYPGLPLFHNAKLGREALDEIRTAIWFATAYDLIYNSPALSEQQKKHIENDLFRELADIIPLSITGLFPDIIMGGASNWQAVANTGIGVIGFLLKDRSLVESAINGPVGFHYQMEKGVHDNGMWFEGSIVYHNFVVTQQAYLAEAAWRSGINLYKNKKYANMFTLPFRLAFPDGSAPLTNDAVRFERGSPEHPRILAEIYFARTGDPMVEPYLIPGKITGFQIYPTPAWPTGFISPVDLALSITPTWQKTEARTIGSEDLAPSFGILRTDKKEDPIYLLMDYGPHGGTHGHPDKLNIVLWANGRVQAPDLSTCHYEFPQWAEWYKQTISHNTVVVDEKPQYPGSARMNMFKVSPRAKIMDGSTVTDNLSDEVDFSTKRGIPVYPYPIPRTRRTIVLLDESFVLDLFTVAQGVTFDWAYRNFGVFHTDENLTPQAEPLGKTFGYQYITNVRRGKSSSDTWTATWTEEGQGVKLTMLDVKDTELIAADSLGQNDLNHTIPMVIARRKPTEYGGGSQGEFQDPITFKTVLEPFRGKPAIKNVKEIKVENGDAICVEIQKKDSVHSFFLAFDWRLKTAGDITYNGHMFYLTHKTTESGKSVVPDYVYMIEGSRLKQGGFSLNTELNTTLYLERIKDNEYVLGHQGQATSQIEIAGRDWRGVQISKLSAAGKPTKKTQARIVDGKLIFDAEAETQYRISFGK